MGFFLFLWLLLSENAWFVTAEEAGCGPFQYYRPANTYVTPKETNNASTPTPPILQVALDQLDDWMHVMMEEMQAPSVSYGVVYDQALVHYGSVGVLDKHTKQTPTADSIFRIGSISKVWTVLMALKLRDDGVFSMDDPIAKLNPDFSVNNPWGVTQEERRGKTLTVQQLASQVSGLSREVPCGEIGDCEQATTKEILDILASEQTLLHATDVQPSYSNLAYAILGNVLSEYVGDESYNQTLFQTLIEPMQLKHTGLYLSDEQKPYAATGYDSDDDGATTDWVDLGWEGPAGQLFSSVRDLSSLLMQFFAAYPSLYQQELDDTYNFAVAPQSLREMLRPVFINPDQKTGFGAPWEIFMRDGHMVRSKGGNVPGFSSEIALIPELKLGFVALFNCDGQESLVTTSALDILIPAFTSWVNERKASEFVAPSTETTASTAAEKNDQTDMSSKSVFENILGTYGVDGVDELTIRIALDRVSGFPVMSIPLVGTRALLTPVGSGVSATSLTKNGTTTTTTSTATFIYNDMYSDSEYCFTITIGGMDGLPLVFHGSTPDGAFQGFRTEGFYGVEFLRKSNVKKAASNNGMTHEEEAVHQLRGGSVNQKPLMSLDALLVKFRTPSINANVAV